MQNFNRSMVCTRGIGLAFVLVLLALLMLLSVAATYHFRQAKGVAASENRQRNLHLMAQAAYGLSMESSDADSDGVIEPPAMSIASLSPGDGGEIPATSGAPRTDAWGTPYGYCAWDNGATNSSTNRLTGDNPGSDSSIVFALISAGPDRQFAATCANIKAGAVNGDDIVQTYTVAQLRQGLPKDAYQGVPVTDGAALSALNTSGLLKGQMRIQDDASELMAWTGAGWSEVVTNGGAGGINLYNRFKNYFLNGDMMITQRGASFSASVSSPGVQTVKTADHWRTTVYSAASGSIGANVTINPSGNSYGLWPNAFYYLDLYSQTYFNDGVTYLSVEQAVEGVTRLAGKTMTLSLYGSDIDGGTTLQIWVTQNFGTGGSPSASISTKAGAIRISSGWAKSTATFTIPAIPAGTAFGANSDDYTLVSLREYSSNEPQLALLQLEEGSQATSFEHLDAGLELALCQRYFESGDTSAASTENYATYYWPVTGALARGIKFRTPKRAAPAVTIKARTGGAVTVSNRSMTGFTASQSVGAAGQYPSAFGWQADADW